MEFCLFQNAWKRLHGELRFVLLSCTTYRSGIEITPHFTGTILRILSSSFVGLPLPSLLLVEK